MICDYGSVCLKKPNYQNQPTNQSKKTTTSSLKAEQDIWKYHQTTGRQTQTYQREQTSAKSQTPYCGITGWKYKAMGVMQEAFHSLGLNTALFRNYGTKGECK